MSGSFSKPITTKRPKNARISPVVTTARSWLEFDCCW